MDPETTELSGREWARENQDALEREANSDLPHAWVAQSILNTLDEEQ
jgi:hypothetical protein